LPFRGGIGDSVESKFFTNEMRRGSVAVACGHG
jgi:hypothetical protein